MYYYVIDSFTETRFGGNPAGVVIHKNLEHDFMQKFATEVRFSETAFVKRLENNRFEVKFLHQTVKLTCVATPPSQLLRLYWIAS